MGAIRSTTYLQLLCPKECVIGFEGSFTLRYLAKNTPDLRIIIRFQSNMPP